MNLIIWYVFKEVIYGPPMGSQGLTDNFGKFRFERENLVELVEWVVSANLTLLRSSRVGDS